MAIFMVFASSVTCLPRWLLYHLCTSTTDCHISYRFAIRTRSWKVKRLVILICLKQMKLHVILMTELLWYVLLCMISKWFLLEFVFFLSWLCVYMSTCFPYLLFPTDSLMSFSFLFLRLLVRIIDTLKFFSSFSSVLLFSPFF